MSIELSALRAPIDGPHPAGPDLEYADVAELDRIGSAACRADGGSGLAARAHEASRWHDAALRARSVLGRTKDLRAALWFVHAQLAIAGVSGLALGLRLVAALLSDFGDALHPCAEPDDAGSPSRLGLLLEGLWPEPSRHQLTEVASHFRALLLTHLCTGQADPARGFDAPDPADPDAPSQAIVALQEIDRHFDARGWPRPAISGLRDCLLKAAQQVARFPGPSGPLGQSSLQAIGNAMANPFTGAAQPRERSLASREDVMLALQEASEYLRRAEPSSPAPLFIERALRLMQMDFTAIVDELIPESASQLRQLAGDQRAPAFPKSPSP